MIFILGSCQIIFSQNQNDTTDTFSLGDFGFDLGIGLNKLKERSIKRSSLHENIVVIEKSLKSYPSFWLETNFIFDKYYIPKLESKDKGSGKKIDFKEKKFRTIRPGFFVSAKIDDSQIFSGFAIGGILAFKRLKNNPKNNSLNIGIGYSRTAITTFADGINVGEPLPPNFEQIVMEEKWTDGILLIVSFRIF